MTKLSLYFVLALALALGLTNLASGQGPSPSSSNQPTGIDDTTLPYNGTVNTSGTAFGVVNTGSGSGAVGLAGRTDNGYAGVVGYSANQNGVFGLANSGGIGVLGRSTSGYGIQGQTTSGSAGVYGTGARSGVLGVSTGASYSGVYGRNDASGVGVTGSSSGIGVMGTSSSKDGVVGQSQLLNMNGVRGEGYTGVRGVSTINNGNGVVGIAQSGSLAYAVFGSSSTGYAGYFNGAVRVNGTVSKSAGAFEIDHPLDPANRILRHSFVESPDMKNVYDGVVTTDKEGLATVTLPDYFGALNRDFRYQLTIVGKEWAQARVEEEISDNHFVIRTDKPGIKVSWQVTGTRQDAYAKAHPIIIEEAKPAAEKGFYYHPDLFGQAETKSVEWAHKPELMKSVTTTP